MVIKSNTYRLFFIILLASAFIAGGCSKPAEDKKTSQTEKTAEKTLEKVSQPAIEKTPAPEPAVTTEPLNKEKDEIAGASADKTDTVKPAAAKEPVKTVQKPVTPETGAESKMPDNITMDNPAYSAHKKGIVIFTHKKHIQEHKIGCGECHHDKDGKPLNNLTENDEVKGCIACHTKPGKAPRKKGKEKLSSREKLKFHAEALHKNCIVCHKTYNKKNNTKAAPSSCSKCHPKKG